MSRCPDVGDILWRWAAVWCYQHKGSCPTCWWGLPPEPATRANIRLSYQSLQNYVQLLVWGRFVGLMPMTYVTKTGTLNQVQNSGANFWRDLSFHAWKKSSGDWKRYRRWEIILDKSINYNKTICVLKGLQEMKNKLGTCKASRTWISRSDSIRKWWADSKIFESAVLPIAHRTQTTETIFIARHMLQEIYNRRFIANSPNMVCVTALPCET